MHPKFVAALYEQDIALLHLEEELVFSASVLPICLPPPGAGKMQEMVLYGGLIVFNFVVSDTGRFPYLGRLATLTGWGRHWDKGPLAKGQVHSCLCYYLVHIEWENVKKMDVSGISITQ